MPLLMAALVTCKTSTRKQLVPHLKPGFLMHNQQILVTRLEFILVHVVLRALLP